MNEVKIIELLGRLARGDKKPSNMILKMQKKNEYAMDTYSKVYDTLVDLIHGKIDEVFISDYELANMTLYQCKVNSFNELIGIGPIKKQPGDILYKKFGKIIKVTYDIQKSGYVVKRSNKKRKTV